MSKVIDAIYRGLEKHEKDNSSHFAFIEIAWDMTKEDIFIRCFSQKQNGNEITRICQIVNKLSEIIIASNQAEEFFFKMGGINSKIKDVREFFVKYCNNNSLIKTETAFHLMKKDNTVECWNYSKVRKPVKVEISEIIKS